MKLAKLRRRSGDEVGEVVKGNANVKGRLKMRLARRDASGQCRTRWLVCSKRFAVQNSDTGEIKYGLKKDLFSQQHLQLHLFGRRSIRRNRSNVIET